MKVTPTEQAVAAVAKPPPPVRQRRHDVDWLRTLALALLIVYHVAISFQPWAWTIGFPQNEEPLEWLWTVLSAINIWRIPILFLISGMGVRFAMERRDWKQLLTDRTLRILLPLIFGFFVIAPLTTAAVLSFYGKPLFYLPGLAHLWFLGNIYVYVLLLLPLLFYMKNRPENRLFTFLSALFRRPAALFLTALPVALEAFLLDPDLFEVYAETPHGFFLGLVCFFTGFLFISRMDDFWPSVQSIRWPALAVAFLLYTGRLIFAEQMAQPWLTGIESMCWMLAILGFGARHLNRSSAGLRYFSSAVYPVYIVHLPVQFLLAQFLLPLDLPPFLTFLALMLSTFSVSLLLYEFVLRRVNLLRPLFGMKWLSGSRLN